jgi:hypothetical protein
VLSPGLCCKTADLDAVIHEPTFRRTVMTNRLFSSGFRVVLGGRGASAASNLFDALSHEAAVLMQREIETIAIRVRHVESLEARLKIQAGIAFARSVDRFARVVLGACRKHPRSKPAQQAKGWHVRQGLMIEKAPIKFSLLFQRVSACQLFGWEIFRVHSNLPGASSCDRSC